MAIDESKFKEKLERIERLDKKLSDSLMNLDFIDIRTKSTEKANDDLKANINELSQSIAEIKKDLSKHTELTDDFSSILSNHKAIIERFKGQHDKHSEKYLKIEQLENSINHLQDKQNKLEHKQNNLVLKTSFDDHLFIFNEANFKLKDDIKEHSKELDEIQKSVTTLFARTQASNEQFNGLVQKLDEFSERLKQQKVLIEDLQKNLNSTIVTLRVEISNLIDRKINESLPKFELSAVLDPVKEALKEELSSVITDSANASLKYNNIDTQVKLLEKKIENLYLILRKSEISKTS